MIERDSLILAGGRLWYLAGSGYWGAGRRGRSSSGWSGSHSRKGFVFQVPKGGLFSRSLRPKRWK